MIAYSQDIKNLLLPLNQKGSPYNYLRMIEDFSFKGEQLIRDQITQYLEKMDMDFRNSPGRSASYYVKATRKRTIITMFGEISYKRTIYKDRLNDRTYCYVDEKMGIARYQRYGNDVACYAAEAYCDENSMIKVGIELGNLIYSKFSLCDNRLHAIPRQTIQRMICRINEVRINPETEKKQVEALYVLMDEKYLPDHHRKDENGKETGGSKMTKTALICEGLNTDDPHRHRYINPKYFSSYKTDFSADLINFIFERYDFDTLKQIHVLADGANWIKAVSEELKFPQIETTQYLCRFHFHQALWRICKNRDLYDKACEYLYKQDKTSLNQLFDSIDSDNNQAIRRNISYIQNNWKLISNSIGLSGMNCAMEQAIAHHIHSQFDNVPKVYGDKKLNCYLSLRDNYRNHENVRCLYVEGLIDKQSNPDSSRTLINRTKLDLSDLEARTSLPYYSASLNNGKNPSFFKPHDDYRFMF